MGDNGKFAKYDLTNIDNYEGDYADNWYSKVEKIYELPDIKDMAGVIVRSMFKNDRQANAILRLAYRHKKFNLNNHQELLRMKLASLPAIGGVGRLDALFAAVNLIAPDMYRTARGMPKYKKGKSEDEKVHRGSDFRENARPQEEVQR